MVSRTLVECDSSAPLHSVRSSLVPDVPITLLCLPSHTTAFIPKSLHFLLMFGYNSFVIIFEKQIIISRYIIFLTNEYK